MNTPLLSRVFAFVVLLSATACSRGDDPRTWAEFRGAQAVSRAPRRRSAVQTRLPPVPPASLPSAFPFPHRADDVATEKTALQIDGTRRRVTSAFGSLSYEPVHGERVVTLSLLQGREDTTMITVPFDDGVVGAKDATAFGWVAGNHADTNPVDPRNAFVVEKAEKDPSGREVVYSARFVLHLVRGDTDHVVMGAVENLKVWIRTR